MWGSKETGRVDIRGGGRRGHLGLVVDGVDGVSRGKVGGSGVGEGLGARVGSR
jgi:hypothetical protein